MAARYFRGCAQIWTVPRRLEENELAVANLRVHILTNLSPRNDVVATLKNKRDALIFCRSSRLSRP